MSAPAKQGGKRVGAGRKHAADPVIRAITVKLTHGEFAMWSALGAAPMLRALLQAKIKEVKMQPVHGEGLGSLVLPVPPPSWPPSIGPNGPECAFFISKA